MNYQWYPGHMTKARRMMQEDIKLIDLVIELLDARVPFSSRNPDIDKMGRDKARLILLNKSDLADEKSNEAWVAFFEACHEKIERDKRKGIKNRPVRAMVVGIPNVGKSTFINAYAGKACAKTGNKPGVTKGKQWIRLNKGLELLDTPGILWPKFEDQSVGMRLAMIGSIKDEILNTDELALHLIRFLLEYYPGRLTERYGCEETAQEALTVYEEIARRRGCIKKGQELDYTKTGMLLLDDFRSGKLGRITLELPKGETEEQ